MSLVEKSVRIEAPIEGVFAYASDWRHWAEWFEGVSDLRPTTARVRGNGARFRYRAKAFGLAANVETEIRNFAENRGWTGVSLRGLSHTTRWSFSSSNGSTLFTYRLEYRMPIPLIGSMIHALAMKKEWTRIVDRSLRNLKATLERLPTSGSRALD